MKKIKLCAYIMLLCLCFTACGKVNDNLEIKSDCKSKEGIVIYDHWNNNLVLYDTINGSVQKLYDEENTYQYEFNTSNRYYTTGNNENGDFKIIEIIDGKVKEVYKMENKEDAIFPLAADEDRNLYYFLIYRGTVGEEREIVKLSTDGDLELCYKTNEKISDGAIINDKLLYSVYKEDKDTYDIYEMKTEIASEKQNNSIIYEDIEGGEIYEVNQNIFLEQNGKLYSKTKEFTKKIDNHFIEKYHILIQIDASETGELMCYITDTNNGRVIKKIKNPIDYEINDGTMKVYCQSEIEEIKLEK